MSFESVAVDFVPELLLLAGALLVFLLDVLKVRRPEVLGGITLGAISLALLGVLADLGTAGLGVFRTLPASAVDAAPGATALYDPTSLGLIFQAIFLLSAGLVALASLSRDPDEPGAAIFFGLLQTATLGMLLVAVASDLIFLLLAIEVVGISTYLLVGYNRRDERSIEASMKFYIVGALSAALSFFGASLLFGAYGGTSLALLAAPPSLPILALFGYGFLIAGLGFKVTAVPFHAWAVDVYDGAPGDVAAFLAGGSKKVGVFAFFLVFLGPMIYLDAYQHALAQCASGAPCVVPVPMAAGFVPSFQIALAVLAVLTMTFGNLLALQQKEMRRMLAYSSISQAGYMLIGVAIGTSPAIAGATLQILAHVFMKVGAFLVVGAAAALGVGPLIEDWKGLGQRRPGLGIAFALMLLSLAGVPLTIGFVSKFVLFSAAVEAQGLFVWLAVAGLLNSAISVFYYARVLRTMFLEEPAAEAAAPLGLPPAEPSLVDRIGYGRTAAIGLAAVAIVALGIDPAPVLGPIQTAVEHFFALGI